MTSSSNPGSWYRLDLGNGAAALEPARKIQEAFLAARAASREYHPEWAVFLRYNAVADNTEAYFVPSVSDLAASFGAYPCDKPTLNEYKIGRLCGNGSVLADYFPDQRI